VRERKRRAGGRRESERANESERARARGSVEGGGWKVEGGRWRVEGGGWRVEGGGYSLLAVSSNQISKIKIHAHFESDSGAS